MSRFWVLLCVALLAAGGACSRGPTARPHHPVVLIGVDGLEWRVLEPLLAAGKMPNLRGLIERGASGRLFTFAPALSPVVWTSVATGKAPRYHGVLDFIDPRSGVPFTSNARRGRALWNIASLHGLDTICVGWWVTYPAEKIHGEMVAPYTSAGQNADNWKGNLSPDLPDQTWPRDLFEEIWPIAERFSSPEGLRELDRLYLGDVDESRLTKRERELVQHARWSEVADETFAAITKHLLEKADRPPDLVMAYIGGTDVASHRFWRYAYPEEFDYPIPEASIEELHDAIERFYVGADRMIGEILRAAPADANVIVCSDHGFHAQWTEAPHPTGISAHHLDGPPGVGILAGPDIVPFGSDAVLDGDPNTEPEALGRVLEVTPVVLYLLGIALPRNMKYPDGGSLMEKAVSAELKRRHPPSPELRSWDDGFRPPSVPEAVDETKVRDFREWLRELGYLGAGGGTFREVLPGKEERKSSRRVDAPEGGG